MNSFLRLSLLTLALLAANACSNHNQQTVKPSNENNAGQKTHNFASPDFTMYAARQAGENLFNLCSKINADHFTLNNDILDHRSFLHNNHKTYFNNGDDRIVIAQSGRIQTPNLLVYGSNMLLHSIQINGYTMSCTGAFDITQHGEHAFIQSSNTAHKTISPDFNMLGFLACLGSHIQRIVYGNKDGILLVSEDETVSVLVKTGDKAEPLLGRGFSCVIQTNIHPALLERLSPTSPSNKKAPLTLHFG